MNQENRQKVLNYIDKLDKCPLYFWDGGKFEKIKLDVEDFNIEDVVIKIMELTRQYPSFNSSDDLIETRSNYWRSCLDIWRHVIYFYPDVEIFDVMHVLYNIEKKCGGQFCATVEKRTFKIKGTGDTQFTNWQKPEHMLLYCNKKTDEFELVWDDWKDI